MASQVTEAHLPLKTQLTTRRHLLCLAKEQAETTTCFLDSLLISGDNFSHLCPGGNIFEWTLSGVRVSMCICVCMCVHVGALWCAGACPGECAHEDAGSWLQMSSSVSLHLIYHGRVFHLSPGLAASASLDSQLAPSTLELQMGRATYCLACTNAEVPNSGPPTCVPSANTWWVTSTACVNHKVHRSLQNNWNPNHLPLFLFLL